MGTDDGNNYVELLRSRACKVFDKPAVAFLRNGEKIEGTLTYTESDLRARATAVRLLAEILPGDWVLVLQPPGLEFVISFLGVFRPEP